METKRLESTVLMLFFISHKEEKNKRMEKDRELHNTSRSTSWDAGVISRFLENYLLIIWPPEEGGQKALIFID